MARLFTVKNISGATGTWLGKTLANNESFEIVGYKVGIWFRDSEFRAAVDAGDIQIVKSTDGGTTYFNTADAQKVYAEDEGGSFTDSNLTGSTMFYADKRSKNKWLRINEIQSSDKAPLIMPFDSVVYALTYVNAKDSTELDVCIYINGTLAFTWAIANQRWAYKTDGLGALQLSAGDRLSIFAKDQGTDTESPLVTVHYSFVSDTTGSGGGTSGV